MSPPTAWPLPAVVDLSRLGQLHDSISAGAGQSSGIHPIPGHDGWLVKLYLKPYAPAEAQRLAHLVGLRTGMPEPDRALAEAATCWPVAAVHDEHGRTVGCVLPQAPGRFRARVRSPGGAEDRFLEIDLLAQPAAAFVRKGLSAPSYAQRMSVCRSLVDVACLLSRYGLVYSDWSYSNAFWSAGDYSAYVIDVDGCGKQRVPNVFQPNWEDWLTPRTEPADAMTDRFRVALLVARILTGERAFFTVAHALDDLPDATVASVLRDCLLAADRMLRPAPSALSATLAGNPYLRMPIALKPLPARPAPPVPVSVPTPTPIPTPIPIVSPTYPPAGNSSVQRAVGTLVLIVAVALLLIWLLN